MGARLSERGLSLDLDAIAQLGSGGVGCRTYEDAARFILQIESASRRTGVRDDSGRALPAGAREHVRD